MGRRNGCNGKMKHPSREAAIITAKRMRRVGFDIYKCRVCGCWHLGTSSKPWKVQARIDQLLGKK